MTRKTFGLFDAALLKPAIVDAFKKLDPRVQWRNPVMFVVYVGSVLTTLLFFQTLGGHGDFDPVKLTWIGRIVSTASVCSAYMWSKNRRWSSDGGPITIVRSSSEW